MNVEKKLKTVCGKCYSVFKGFKGGPFKYTKTFFLQNVFDFLKTFMKNAFDTK